MKQQLVGWNYEPMKKQARSCQSSYGWKMNHSWKPSEDMDGQLFALVVEVGHVRWFHFSEPSKGTSVHGS